MSDVTPPQAGWYSDPENPAAERWWNGSGWSDHKRDATTTAPAAAPADEPADAAVADTGFTFGSPARPDPYAPPPAVSPYTPGYTPPAQPVAPPVQPYYAAPGSPYAPAPYGAPSPSSGANGLAIAGLIVSAAGWIILGALAPIAGIILSAFGLSKARQAEAAGNPNSGRGIAMAGLVVGIVVLAIGLVIAVVYVAFVLSAGYGY